MARTQLLALLSLHCGLLALFASAQAPTGVAPPVELKIVARGAWQLPIHAAVAPPRKQLQWVFRDETELAVVAGPHGLPSVAQALKVDGIDFKKNMLLAVFDGTQPLVGMSNGPAPSAPNRIEIHRVELDEQNKVMTVRWRFVPRRPDSAILTCPLEVVLVPRFEGAVRFERQAAVGENKEEPLSGKEVMILGRAFWADGWRMEEPARQWVVHRYEDLIDPRLAAPEEVLERMRQEAAARYAQALGVKTIDFKKHMIVGVSGGVQSSGGYKVAVTRVEADARGNQLTVHWALHGPQQGEKVAPGLTHPAEVVLVEQFAGEVRFKEQPARDP